MGNYLLSKGASLTQAAAWYTRSSQIRAVDTAEREKHEAARKVAAAEREREEEAEREAARAAAANKKASTGSCTCTRRVSRFVPGREQLRGHYEFYDQSYACPCK